MNDPVQTDGPTAIAVGRASAASAAGREEMAEKHVILRKDKA